MTLNEFLKELAALPNTYKNRHYCNSILRLVKITPRTKRRFEFCPLTAVCYAKKRCYHAPISWRLAAQSLKLNEKIAQKIVWAADGSSYQDPKLRIQLSNIMSKKDPV